MSRSGIPAYLPVILLLLSTTAISQNPPSTTCPNSNFSTGTFQNWNGCYGTFTDPCATQGFDLTSTYPLHTIITDVSAHDPNTCNNLLKIYPGETHSARLGHDAGSTASGSQLKYSIQVTSQPYYFKYYYAVVLDNPGHLPNQQPSFIIEIKDASGNIVDPVHGYHYYGSSSGLPGWQTCFIVVPIVWNDWTSDSVDLSGYAGQTITATFTSRDCYFGGHHGYAYISAYCISPVTRQWTGASDDHWNNPANWDPAGVPSTLDTVIIPQGISVMPVINVSGMSCNELHIGDGTTITIPTGITLTVTGNVILEAPL